MADTPNILVIWGDDIGQSNLSCYSNGLMGYRTPNIDRIADEGALFTDYYGEQSCTAGFAAFITGQNLYRTGLTKVGLPGAELGLQPEEPDYPKDPDYRKRFGPRGVLHTWAAGDGTQRIEDTDSGTTVTPEYPAPFAFTGRIHRVIVDVSGEHFEDYETQFAIALAKQ